MVNRKSNATYYIQIKFDWGKDEIVYMHQIDLGYAQYSDIIALIESGNYPHKDVTGVSYCARWADDSKKSGIDTRILAQRTYPAKQSHRHRTIHKD